MTTTNEEWFSEALCAGFSVRAGTYQLFFDEEYEVEAKAFCHECPTRNECLDYAFAHHVEEGVWGGLNPKERLRFMRQWRRKRSQLAVSKHEYLNNMRLTVLRSNGSVSQSA